MPGGGAMPTSVVLLYNNVHCDEPAAPQVVRPFKAKSMGGAARMMPTDPHRTDYERLAAAVGAARLGLVPSELHGLICGVACTAGERDVAELVTAALAQYGLEAAEWERLQEALRPLCLEVRSTLLEGRFDFALLLPDDAEALDVRIEALAAWCRAFLYGLAEGGVTEPDRLPGDAAEAARDLSALAEAVSDAYAEEEQEERALAELEEYVRVGVQLIFEELHGRRARRS